MPLPSSTESARAGCPVGLVDHHDGVPIDQGGGAAVDLGPTRRLEHGQLEVGAGGPGQGPPHALILDRVAGRVVGLAQARRIGHQDRKATEVEMDLDDVPGGAGGGGDDCRRAPSEGVQEARLADVGGPDDGHVEPLPQPLSPA
jgi:hypothetical protein